jgi:hypothetical protein
MVDTPRKTFPELEALSAPVVNSDVLAVYRSPGPAKRTTATVFADYIKAFFSASGGSALLGFIQAGTGAGARTAQAKMRDVVNMDDYYNGTTPGTEATDSAALKAAITYAATNWLPVILPARRIYWDGSTIADNYVRLWGSGMPNVNSGRTALVGGTIIQGALGFTGDYIDLRDFGADCGSVSGVAVSDAIKCLASPYNSGVYLNTENLVGLCNAPASAVHALLFEGYAQHTGDNLLGVNGFYGVVLKTRNVRIGSMKGYYNSNAGVYFKSDDTFGSCFNVQVDTIEVDGGSAGGTTYAVRLQAAGAESGVSVNGGGLMDNIQIGKIRAKNHGSTLLVQCLNYPNAAFGSAYVGSIVSEGATADDIFVYNLKAGGRLENLEIDSVISINPVSKVVNLVNEAGAEIEMVRIGSVYASYATGVLDAVLDGAVYVGGDVNKTTFSSLALLVDAGRSARLGAANYPNAGGVHILGARRARILGAGRPANGYSEQALSGATAAMAVPRNEAGNPTSFVKLTHAAPITITSFVAPTGDLAFESGHALTVFNGTSNSVTIPTSGGGGILNPGYGSVTLGENDVRTWVIAQDNVWRGLP